MCIENLRNIMCDFLSIGYEDCYELVWAVRFLKTPNKSRRSGSGVNIFIWKT